MYKPGGYEISTGPEGFVEEGDTFTCAHCNKIVRVKPRCAPADLGGFCRRCMKLTCPECSGLSCDPIEKKLERWEARDAFLRSL